LLRRQELCPEPQNCPEVLTEEPDAGPFALPCNGCPRQALDDYLKAPESALLQATVDLDYALIMGITLTLDKIPYPVFILLRQLFNERQKYNAEEIKKSQQQQSMSRRRG
jgi:hypothetical protein